jgi:hypothetical protein
MKKQNTCGRPKGSPPPKPFAGIKYGVITVDGVVTTVVLPDGRGLALTHIEVPADSEVTWLGPYATKKCNDFIGFLPQLAEKYMGSQDEVEP